VRQQILGEFGNFISSDSAVHCSTLTATAKATYLSGGANEGVAYVRSQGNDSQKIYGGEKWGKAAGRSVARSFMGDSDRYEFSCIFRL